MAMRGEMATDFYLSIFDRGRTKTLSCSGELDLSTCQKLEDAFALCLESHPSALHLDLSQLSLLTSAGIESLLRIVERAYREEIEVELSLSTQARRILDLVGLWWIGVIDDGVAIDAALANVHRSYLEARPEIHKGPSPL
jgi:anti-anti-sigma factor